MPHDPQTMSLFFSIGHWLTGAFAFPIAVLVAWQAVRRDATVPQIGLPLLIAGAGVALALFIVFHAGLAEAHRMLDWALGQPQQLQHFAFSALLIVIGISEWIAGGHGKGFGLVWPIGYILMGAAFIVHEQIGDNAHDKWIYHVALGTAILVAGILRLAQRRGWMTWRTGGVLFAVALAVVGTMMVTFREDAPLHLLSENEIGMAGPKAGPAFG